MSWNDYIDKSYEMMISKLAEEGYYRAYNRPLEDLKSAVEEVAKTVIEKSEYQAEKDLLDIIFDEFAQEDMEEMGKRMPFFAALCGEGALSADRIAQKCANEINRDAVFLWLLDSLNE